MNASYKAKASGVTHDTLTMRISDAAKALSIGRTTVYKLIGEGTLRTISVGRRRLILTRSIQELCDQPQSMAQPHDASAVRANHHH
ncbi:excisionase family DNA-binding protein [uncultured Sphingomonas sp.]|uniref:excisionase family DNA-binding protein n=1 Tax=uncultured Sphingomonas sp. TaxID=158754 RepID=UPI00374A27F3